MVEFSLAKPEKPIPIGTVRVYFTCRDNDGAVEISFRFQKDSLIHYVNKSIRHKEVEKWIDDALAKKLLVRETVFYLGTAYDNTRVKDERQDRILAEVVKPPQIQFIQIHPDLLADQKWSMQVMENRQLDQSNIQKQMKQFFKDVDCQNIGVITYEQFATLVKNVGINLNKKELKELLLKMDPSETGTVEYENYSTHFRQIFECLQAKKIADKSLKTKKEEQIFGSILMLINDESQDTQQILIQKFKEKDEDETGLCNISEVKNILDELNKSLKEKKNIELITALEMAEIAKSLTDEFGYKEIPYSKIHKMIMDLKVQEISRGRVNHTTSNLEVYIKDLFVKLDEKKYGKIKLEQLETALTKASKIKLTKAQLFLIKNLLPVSPKGQVNYLQHSKFMAETIKKFYIHSSKRKH